MEQGRIDFEASALITEERIVSPLVRILDNATPQAKKAQSQSLSQSESFTKSITDLFPEQQYEEKAIQTAKKILGDIADELTPSELKDTVVEVMYLTETWLDEFEKEIFKGKTLNELLHEKGDL